MIDTHSLNVKLLKNVYTRTPVHECSLDSFIFHPDVIYDYFGIKKHAEELYKISKIKDKEQRNQAKRNFMPAVDLSETGILSIDLDNLADNKRRRRKVITILKKFKHTFAVMESASGNLVALFKYDCEKQDFKKLYNRVYLELQIKLEVDIDYLPEIGRLRYVSCGEVFYFNEYSKPLTQLYHGEVKGTNAIAVQSKEGKKNNL